MTGAEYLAIMNENGWKRSKLVKILEESIRVLERNGKTEEAEEAKWIAIDIAEQEKEQGYLFLEG